VEVVDVLVAVVAVVVEGGIFGSDGAEIGVFVVVLLTGSIGVLLLLLILLWGVLAREVIVLRVTGVDKAEKFGIVLGGKFEVEF
jgi:hypothetical protein